jgi:hypothetical protein
MTKRLALLLVVAVALVGCQPATGPTIINTNTATNNQQGGGANAPPAPGQGGELPAGSTVRVGMYGQSCPSGVTSPSNGSRQIKPGCTAFITATPKASDGTDLPSSVHGPTIAWSVPAGSGVVNVLADSEPFNRTAKCIGVGVFTLSATVKGVTGSADFECLASADVSASDAFPPPADPPPPTPRPQVLGRR